jgi:hypothetical protein
LAPHYLPPPKTAGIATGRVADTADSNFHGSIGGFIAKPPDEYTTGGVIDTASSNAKAAYLRRRKQQVCHWRSCGHLGSSLRQWCFIAQTADHRTGNATGPGY